MGSANLAHLGCSLWLCVEDEGERSALRWKKEEACEDSERPTSISAETVLGRETLVGLAVFSEAVMLGRLVDVVCKRKTHKGFSRVRGLAEQAPPSPGWDLPPFLPSSEARSWSAPKPWFDE